MVAWTVLIFSSHDKPGGRLIFLLIVVVSIVGVGKRDAY